MSDFLGDSFGDDFGDQFGDWSGTSVPDPAAIFGSALKHEWDLGLSTVTIATGISSIADLRGGKDLTQGTPSKQPAYTSAGLLSKSTSTAASSQGLNNTALAEVGLDVTLLVVGRYTSVSAASIATLGSDKLILKSASSIFSGTFDDATGADVVSSGVSTDTTPHAFALMNATGVRRKIYVGGGAGAAGARTDDIDSSTRLGIHANGNTASAFSSSDIYWVGVVRPSPSLAQLNQWGAWAASRYGSVGVTWSTAT